MKKFLGGGYIETSNGKVKHVDIMTWAKNFEDAGISRKVGLDVLFPGIRVSTVFLGIDHGFCDIGQPVLYETMFFIGRHGDNERRYCTRAEAEQGHAEAVESIRPLHKRILFLYRFWRSR